jgi:hypothetical protein
MGTSSGLDEEQMSALNDSAELVPPADSEAIHMARLLL